MVRFFQIAGFLVFVLVLMGMLRHMELVALTGDRSTVGGETLAKQILSEIRGVRGLVSAQAPSSARCSTTNPALDGFGFGKDPSTLDIAPDSFEAKIARQIPIADRKRFLPERYPMPPIDVFIDTAEGCLLGSKTCAHLIPSGVEDKVFNNDPHILQIVMSTLMDCKFRTEPCYAIDIGANFGFLSLSMLQLNTYVVSVEPQLDLCASLMASVQRGGVAHHSRVHCGALASSKALQDGTRWFPNFKMGYRYGDDSPAKFTYDKYGLESGVPVIKLADLLPPPGTIVKMIKIDTDSIDCDILRQILDRIKRGVLEVRAMTFEGNNYLNTCPDLYQPLYAYQKLGYTVYRTLLWQWHFDSKGSFPKAAKGHDSSKYADEVFELRFNRYLWRMHDNLTENEWKLAIDGTWWQFHLTKEKYKSFPMEITEKT